MKRRRERRKQAILLQQYCGEHESDSVKLLLGLIERINFKKGVVGLVETKP